MIIDQEFKKKLDDLRVKLYEKKISGTVFWETYKKILLKSVGKNKKTAQQLIKKTDKRLKQQFKEAEQQTKDTHQFEKGIDQLVYKLYGRTEKEIAIV